MANATKRTGRVLSPRERTPKDNFTSYTFRLQKETVDLLKKELGEANLSAEIRALLELRLRGAMTNTPVILGSEVARVCSDACGRYGASPAHSALVREVALYIRDALLMAAADDGL